MNAAARVRGRRSAALALLAPLATLLLAACTTTTSRTVSVPAAETAADSAAPEPGDAERRARVRLELASAYFGRGQTATALDEVKLALAAKPDFAAAYNLSGLIYASLADPAQAEQNFRRALQLDARDADAMQNYGWFLCQQQRYGEADAMFSRALAVPQYPDVPRTLLTQGICHARAGRFDAAEASLRRALELEPENPGIAVNLSEVLYRRGDYERARQLIRRVNASADVSNASTLWLAARIEHRLANAQGTQALGKQLRDRFPNAPETGAFERGQFE